MPYCDVDDLLVGDLRFGNDVLQDRFVLDAADEIDGALGVVYSLPITQAMVPAHSWKTLKRCNAHLATGRLLMAVGVPGEEDAVHAYALFMLREGHELLAALASGQIPLPGVPQVPGQGDFRAPMIVQGDIESGVDTFYRYTMGDEDVAWRPGLIPAPPLAARPIP